MTFAQIPGLEETKKRLVSSIHEGMIAHALLFQGKPGALNLPLALAYATFVHCENRQIDDACGQCPACLLNKKYIHPDTHFAYPVGNMKAELKIKDDEEELRSEIKKMWRAFLIETPFGAEHDWINYYGGEDKQPIISREDGREIIRNLSLKPFQSKFKLMIIWQPEMMHAAAANGILKILEEPPANTIFILASNRAEQLLPTILSRTQHVTVPLLSDEEIESKLLSLGVDKTKTATIVTLADGNLGLALRLVDEEDPHHHEVFSNWMRACFQSDFSKIIPLADEFHEKDRMYQRSFIQYAMSMIRETLLGISGAQALHRTRGGERAFVDKFKTVFNLQKLDASYALLNDASYFLERNGSAKMIFTDLSIQFSRVLRG
jgi:DNA polymerase III subunit delta'